MDEAQMHEWVAKVLKPWKDHRDASNPSAEPPPTASHLGCIPRTSDGFGGKLHPDDGIEVLHIPAGCTYLCQPIDVGINKPIKCGLREKWEQWMVDGEGIIDDQAMEPSWQMIAEWLVEVYNNIPEETRWKAWKKRDYEWMC